MKKSLSEILELRGRQYHVRIWHEGANTDDGEFEGKPPTLFFLHGWGDVGASFQFVVDALPGHWRVIAPDWRGFGGSQWNDGAYWFVDYLADLDALLAHYSPAQPVALVGHSLGGIVASIYAGTRPERVARFANLEGFAPWVMPPEETPGRLGKWLDEVAHGAPSFRPYAQREEFIARMRRDNQRLSAERAAYLAEHALRADGDRFVFAADPRHRWTSPVLFPLPDAIACWRRIRARCLLIAGRQSPFMQQFTQAPELPDGADRLEQRRACFGNADLAWIDDCGHNLHHDQPEALAHLLVDFFAEAG